MYKLRFRQVHLDFHTAPAIEGVGVGFDAGQWQDSLRRAHVNSITCFGICHHGWNYNDTRVGKRHPHLAFDLLRAQFEAAREIDVNVPIYITAGVNNRIAEAYPQWREVTPAPERGAWMPDPLAAGFKKLCFNSPYTDHLCELIEELVRQFPDCNGVFLDIIQQNECCCECCKRSMRQFGLDPSKQEDRREMSRRSLERYYRMSTAAARCANPELPVFHNSGHIARGRREILPYFSHLELESLPTGGWGYDHFPVSAKYAHLLDKDILGMTGKFHTTWGEFGGYKHPNALRYECAAMLALGAKCGVGDQLHPSGAMDQSTCDIIGTAYAEVEAKEPWCDDVKGVADIGLLSSAAMDPRSPRNSSADDGAARILLEGHFLFDVLDADMAFDPYRVLILPDDIRVDDALVRKVDAFLAHGGKLLLTGCSGMHRDGSGQAFDIGASMEGQSPYQPDYVMPIAELAPEFVSSPLVMVLPSQRIKVRGGTSLGQVHDPYFNRTWDHFCSHQHAPARPEPSGYDCGTLHGSTLYLAHPVFTQYRGTGAVVHRHYATRALRMLLGDETTVTTNLPSTARVTLMDQAAHNRYVLHLLYAPTVSRGGAMQMSSADLVRATHAVEVIEDLVPLRDSVVSLRLPRRVGRATLEPQGAELAIRKSGDRVDLTVAEFTCHQMVALHD